MASSYEPRLERRYEGVEGMEEILLSVDVRGGWVRDTKCLVKWKERYVYSSQHSSPSSMSASLCNL